MSLFVAVLITETVPDSEFATYTYPFDGSYAMPCGHDPTLTVAIIGPPLAAKVAG